MVAGHIFDEDGLQRPVGELRQRVLGFLSAAHLTSRERLVVSEFFGLWAFPAEISGTRGVVAFSGVSKTIAEEAIESAMTKLAGHVEPFRLAVVSDLVLQAEVDPFTTLATNDLFTDLPDDDQLKVKRAAIRHAFDLTDRASNAGDLQAGVMALAVRHNVQQFSVETGRISVRQEHRNAARAACSIALHELIRSENLPAISSGKADTLLLATRRSTIPGRQIEHPRYGLFSAATLDSDLFILLAGHVFNRDDPNGLYADLAIEVLLSGQAAQLLDRDTFETVIYALVRGLASHSNWRVIDLANWYAASQPLAWNTVLFTSWAGHVASNHQFDQLAWRLTRTAERQIALLPAHSYGESQHKLATYQIELIRSGCCLREADRHVAASKSDAARAAWAAGNDHLHRARTAWTSTTTKSTNGVEGLSLALRRIELLLLGDLMVAAGHDIDTEGAQRTTALRLMGQAQELIDQASSHDQDVEQYQNRLDLLTAAFARLG